MARRILALLAGLVVAVTLTGWTGGQQWLSGGRRSASGTQQPQAADAVAGLVAGRPVVAMPGDFAAVMRYRASTAQGSGGGPDRSGGGCSSPFGQSAFGFGSACKQHDLGYDLLRYAAIKGQPLGPWARQGLDRRFGERIRASCHNVSCRIVAAGYVAAVQLNSWRQGYGVPVRETLSTVAPAGAGGLATALLLGGVPWPRRARARVRTGPRALAGERGRWLAATVRGRVTSLPAGTAGLGLAASLEPSMLPHPWWVQGPVGGVLLAQGCAVGLGLRRAGRPVVRAVRRRLPERPARRIGDLVALLLPPVVVVALAIALTDAVNGQAEVSSRLGVGAPGPAALLAGIAVALAVGLLLLGAARSARSLLGALLGRVGALLHRLGAPLRGPSGPGGPSGPSGPSGPAWSAGTRTRMRAVGAVLVVGVLAACTSPDPAAGPGPKAREFLSQAQAAARISTVTGRPAVDPIRVYVGLEASSSVRQRADLAVDALARAGAFRRAALLVVVPTGSGWVNPAAPAALEYLYGGDVATVAVQYASSPSWLAYLSGGEGVRASVHALFDALHRRWQQLPETGRPRLLVYGESLGAWGGLTAYPATGGLAPGVDAALWAGLPSGTPAVPAHVPGRVRVLVHPDDPVPIWSPALLTRRVQGWHRAWYPLVTFWQATEDVISARLAPDGHGHRYGSELVDAWWRLAPPDGVPGGAGPDRLGAVRRALPGAS